VWPPGQVWSYSNWGADLAGYIVQEVSGVPFNQYVGEHIFTPLGMNNTTIEQPVPPPLAANVSKAYAYSDGAFEQLQPKFVGMVPDGGIHSTASDMAKFMIAHLNNGSYNRTRILNASTAQDMHRSHFTPDLYTKFGLGFFIGAQNNESSISHAGDLEDAFHTLCVLWPERNVGLFVSYNGPGGSLARYDLVQEFLDHYYPYTPTPPQPGNFNDAPALTGTYQTMRTVYTTPLKYFIFLSEPPRPVDITGNPNGTLTAPGSPFTPVEIAPLVFANPSGAPVALDGSYHDIFTTDSNGTRYHADAFPQYYERLPWYATPAGVTNLGYLCLAVFLSAAIWPVGDLYGRWQRWRGTSRAETTLPRTRLPSLAHWVMGIVAVLYWLFFLLVPYLVAIVLGEQGLAALANSLSIPLPIVAWLTLPLIAIPLTIVGVILTVLAWSRRYWTPFGRIHYTVVVGAALAFIIWLSYWNLIGFRW
jgi:hypothetical protein